MYAREGFPQRYARGGEFRNRYARAKRCQKTQIQHSVAVAVSRLFFRFFLFLVLFQGFIQEAAYSFRKRVNTPYTIPLLPCPKDRRGPEDSISRPETHLSSILIKQGENIKYIQSQLGHATPTVTLNVYAHLMDSSNQETACRFENTVFGESGSNLVAEG